MSSYMLVISLHVVIALLGTGLLVAIPFGARGARRLSLELEVLGAWLRPVFRIGRAGLGLAFLSGALLDYLAGGAFHEAGWFRLAGLLLVVAVSCQLGAQAALKRGLAGKLSAPVALRRIELWGVASISAVAGIAVLMEWKPF
jgi:hypothetical protein